MHYVSLNFFSEAGLRFFLPANLIADLNGELETADPLFILVHGFCDLSVEHKVGSRIFVHMTGKSTFINPRRYGVMTFFDYADYRLSIFTREEAQPIVFYLKLRQEIDSVGMEREQIEAALNLFWLERAEVAPTAQDITVHMLEEDEYLAAISSQVDEKS
jgi:hypothetical protein